MAIDDAHNTRLSCGSQRCALKITGIPRGPTNERGEEGNKLDSIAREYNPVLNSSGCSCCPKELSRTESGSMFHDRRRRGLIMRFVVSEATRRGVSGRGIRARRKVNFSGANLYGESVRIGIMIRPEAFSPEE